MRKTDKNLYLTMFTGAAQSERLEEVCRWFGIPVYARVLAVGYGVEGRRLQSVELGWLAPRSTPEGVPLCCPAEAGLREAAGLQFDCVVLVDVVQHLGRDECGQLMGDAWQMVGRGGSLVCGFRPRGRGAGNRAARRQSARQQAAPANPPQPQQRAGHRQQALTIERFERICRSQGLQVAKRSLWWRRAGRGRGRHKWRVLWPLSRLRWLRNCYTSSAWYRLVKTGA